MKKNFSFYFMLAILAGMTLVFSNCTKEGPAGPAGANGTNGINGTDGTDGVDGNSTCLECHTAAYMDAINTSFNEHKHVIGTSWARGTSGSCGMCHSHDGFVEFVRSGTMIGAEISTPLTCATCHDSHSSLEDGISAPMRSVPVPTSLITEGAVYEHGGGNLCATCHQARRGPASYYGTEDGTFARKFTGDDIATYQAHGAVGPNGSIELVGDTLFVVFDVPVATHTYTNSTHAGPHHGPQANMFAADMGSVIGTPFDRDHHTDCASCHLTNAEVGGGHTFVPDNAMCNACHSEAGYDMEAEQAEIAARLHAVEVALEAAGAIHVADDGVHPMYASLETAKWNAFWNYMCLYEDNSNGLHNFNYAKQLLTQCESALGI
ncbi:hypothetical protein HNS38_09790 [Lentimicrobium sp. L6]|uniref:cytochrome c3 family protein n=1 Tax=Lentimicrobium sp. L6 TaxID=2735916 RepID=UPI0015548E28|nr:cytochrome c3 family protein [Lentimicrobium sp. L6]NPD85050.1 hypothetical protein [Lentimicrobium sp. L6]